MYENIVPILKNCRLCKNMTEDQILQMLKAADSNVRHYSKGEFVFVEGDTPVKLFILIEGKVAASRITCSGNRILVTNIEEHGDMFGEVYLFMGKPEYDLQAEVLKNSVILELSASVFDHHGHEEEGVSQILFRNMLAIFAAKAYLLSGKIRLLGSGSIREKIACYIIERQDKQGNVKNDLNREDMADFLNVTRPSLSRELGNMAKEGILKAEGKQITILDQEMLESYL